MEFTAGLTVFEMPSIKTSNRLSSPNCSRGADLRLAVVELRPQAAASASLRGEERRRGMLWMC